VRLSSDPAQYIPTFVQDDAPDAVGAKGLTDIFQGRIEVGPCWRVSLEPLNQEDRCLTDRLLVFEQEVDDVRLRFLLGALF
jgi:hypothetical protein